MSSGPSKELRQKVYDRDGGCCRYCGLWTWENDYPRRTLDHVVPRSRGGGNRLENLVVCCQPCNNRKNEMLLSEVGWRLFPPRYFEDWDGIPEADRKEAKRVRGGFRLMKRPPSGTQFKRLRGHRTETLKEEADRLHWEAVEKGRELRERREGRNPERLTFRAFEGLGDELGIITATEILNRHCGPRRFTRRQFFALLRGRDNPPNS